MISPGLVLTSLGVALMLITSVLVLISLELALRVGTDISKAGVDVVSRAGVDISRASVDLGRLQPSGRVVIRKRDTML